MPAPIPAIHNCALVLAKLDETQSPSYSQEGFRDRLGLSQAVISVINLMTGPSSSQEWCAPSNDIFNNLDRFFDPNVNPNPARDAFTRDFGRVRTLAGCA